MEDSSFAQLIYEFMNSDLSGAWGVALPKPNLSNSDELHTHMLSNVLSFKIVRYYMRGAASPTALTAGSAYPFGPSAEKPVWIEFEIVLRDSNNREDYTSRYRVNLPSR